MATSKPVDWDAVAIRAQARVLGWDELRPQQQQYALLVCKGYSARDACGRLGIPPSTVAHWEQRPWWPQARAHAFGLVARDKGPLIERQRMALATLDGALSGEQVPKTSLAAAMYVLDHIYGRPTARTVVRDDGRRGAESLDDFLDRLPTIAAEVVGE